MSTKFLIDIKTKGAGKSEKEVKGVSGALGGLAKKAALAAGSYFGAKMLLDGIKSSVDLFAKQEEAEKKLRFAAGDMTDSLISQAQALQKVTRFGDEAIIAQQAYLASISLTEDQIKDTISASIDLAAATGMTLESAVMNTSKTLSGMAGELGERLGPAFREITPEALKAGEGIKFIAQQFGGTAQADALSFAGTIDQMQNAFGDAAEAIGELLAPALTFVADRMKITAEMFQVLIQATTETGLERAIREIKELGGDATELELAFNRLEKNKAMDKLGESAEILGYQLTSVEAFNEEIGRQNLEMLDRARERNEIEMQILDVTEGEIELQDLINQMMDQQTGRKYEQELLDLMALQHKRELLLEEDKINKSTIETLDAEKKAHQDINELELEHQALQKKTNTQQEENTANTVAGSNKIAKNDLANAKKMEKQLLKMAGVDKAEDIKESVRDSYKMAQNAYAWGAKVLGPLFGAAMASIAFAAGMTFVSQIKKAQYGADFVTSGPQLMMVGEAGREQVQVTPLEGPNLEGPQGGGITLNISNPIMTDTFVEESIIPSIREGLRLGEAI